jgi:hypothetical protein
MPRRLAALLLAMTLGGCAAAGGSGKITFGTGIDQSTLAVTGPTTVFAPGQKVGWSAALSEPANATTLIVVFAKILPGGGEQSLVTSPVAISNPDFTVLANTSDFSDWATAPGDYVLRVLRDAKVLAEGTFTISTSAPIPASAGPSLHIPGPPATVSGSESSNSAPFRLSGDYDVAASATSSECGFFWGGTLKSPTDPSVYDQIPPGTTHLYGLADGQYYFAAEASSCSWTVTFTPR